MDIFRTSVEIPPSNKKIDYQNPVVLIGSCFTENIGQKLIPLKFKADVNPFGVLYNPYSIKKSLEIIVQKKCFVKEDLFYYNELWHSFFHHSRFSDVNPDDCISKINTRIEKSFDIFRKADFLFITWGAAWVYEKKDSKQIVSNCHKLPSSHFRRFLINPKQIMEEYISLFEHLISFNPSIHIVLTVSPVRHWKDGAVNNQISKSSLLLAASELINKYKQVSYFPAYEIVMDELRDYRFYAEDMIHPNQIATDYIWEKFSETYFTEHTLTIISEIEKIIKAKQHKSFNTQTKAYKKFIEGVIKKCKELQGKYAFLNLTEEIQYFTSQIS